MNLTDAEKHRIFYQAAANIEARPELYSFRRIHVGRDNRPACMWGHIGRVAGFPPYASIAAVTKPFGFSETRALYSRSVGGFRHSPTDGEYGSYGKNPPRAAAARIRAFADHHWPQSEPAAMSFRELMDSLGVPA